MSSARLVLALALASMALAGGLIGGAASSGAAGDITGSFSWSPSSPVAGDTVVFTAGVEPSDGATITSYEWDLDGTGGFEASGSSASRNYPAPTNIRVRLRVKDSANKTKVIRKQLSVKAPGSGGGQAPVASFTFSPSAPFAGQPVHFDSTSSDPDGSIVDEVWDLNGDGNFDNGGGHTALRTFPAPGEYVVGLRVTDDSGLVSFDSQTITVGPAPPSVNQNAAPKALRLMSPFPVVRIAGRIMRRGTRVRLLHVVAPTGAKVSVRCDGRGCPFKKQVRAVSEGPKGKAATVVRVRKLERLIPAGVRIRVFVTRRDTIGKYTRFRFRAGKAPVRVDRCVMPGSWAPSDCPTA
jgi:hypothetical protein